jgi:hypothetical protein
MSNKKKAKNKVLGSMKGYNARERPGCRREIIRRGLRPSIDPYSGLWDGSHAIDARGQEFHLTNGTGTQLGKMAREQFWPELTRKTRKR